MFSIYYFATMYIFSSHHFKVNGITYIDDNSDSFFHDPPPPSL